MATLVSDLSTADDDRPPRPPMPSSRPQASAWGLIKAALLPLASLRLTVVLFALSIFLVLVGTLAQTEIDIWDVIHQYFRVNWCWVKLELFLPYAFFPGRPDLPDGLGFWFPGGWLIGSLLMVNLLSAHALRFTVRARGALLALGTATLGVGIGLTWLVIASASATETLNSAANPVLFGQVTLYDVLWQCCRWGLVLLALAADVFAVWQLRQVFGASSPQPGATGVASLTMGRRWAVVGLSLVVAMALTLVAGYIVSQGEAARIGDAGLRIVWQLVKGGAAGLVLLAGSMLVFRQRGGIVVIHAGIALLMFYELYVGMTAVESQIQLQEGQTVNYTQDIRSFELAVIDTSDPASDRVIVFPRSLVEPSLGSDGQPQPRTIDDPRLPFVIRVDALYRNASVRSLQPGTPNRATMGEGLQWVATEAPLNTGTDSQSKIDLAAGYVTLIDRQGTTLGTILGSVAIASEGQNEKLTIGDKPYEVALRFTRHYKPYSVRLVDVTKEDYVGTSTPRMYASDLVITDLQSGVASEKRIWMNNPLRYAGETFYQSGYTKLGENGPEMTTIQVVTNSGWMAPYVACMLVGIGLVAHFLSTLWRFLARAEGRVAPLPSLAEQTDPRRRPARRAQEPAVALATDGAGPTGTPGSTRPISNLIGWGLPLVILGPVAAMLLVGSSKPVPNAARFDLAGFGSIPVVADGRVKPIDSIARGALLAVSTRESFKDAEGKSHSAVEWLLDVIARPDAGSQHEVFRIENLELLSTLKLEPKGGFRYSIASFFKNMREVSDVARVAREKREQDPKSLSVYERKVLEFESKVGVLDTLMSAFGVPPLDAKPGEVARALISALQRQQEFIETRKPPRAVPPSGSRDEWTTFANGWLLNLTTAITNQPSDKTVELWSQLVLAWDKQDVREFNSAVSQLHAHFEELKLPDVDTRSIAFEAEINRTQPFYTAAILYVCSFVVTCLTWLVARGRTDGAAYTVLMRTAIGLTLLALAMHTYALWARIVISGRPPVTNLYSSAVFIGWGAAVLSLLLEFLFRKGISNALAAIAGFATIQIAYGLAADGADTMAVLQAVLDTQFWLTTHVLCISMGYSTTYLAGFLGIAYIALGTCTPYLTTSLSRDLYKMTYGVLCFAILFSFIGTVLGGLWADDSWGRFWGWDPKENGALIIVLFNALALHARWGGLVRERGLAVLAVLGNIAVSWSWFGVNELGVGLHSYGFSEGMVQKLGLFVLSQLVVAGVGMTPRHLWWSRPESTLGPSDAPPPASV